MTSRNQSRGCWGTADWWLAVHQVTWPVQVKVICLVDAWRSLLWGLCNFCHRCWYAHLCPVFHPRAPSVELLGFGARIGIIGCLLWLMLIVYTCWAELKYDRILAVGGRGQGSAVRGQGLWSMTSQSLQKWNLQHFRPKRLTGTLVCIPGQMQSCCIHNLSQ